MELRILEKVSEVRNWLAGNVDRETLAFPSDDDTWAFITARWPHISAHDAESLLGEAMRPVPYEGAEGPHRRSGRGWPDLASAHAPAVR